MTSSRDKEFEDFVLAAWPRLHRAAYLLSHDRHEAEDLVQAALARSYVHWRRVRREGAYAYVHRALVNAYIDSTRRRTPKPGFAAIDDVPGLDAPVWGARASPDPTVAVEDRDELEQLLAPLTPRERAIIVWRYYFDTPEKVVADRLGVSRGTVRSTASRALARLRASTPTAGHRSTSDSVPDEGSMA